MTFAVASSLFWNEQGQFIKNTADLERSLAWLQKHIGMSTRLSKVNDAIVADLVARRRAEGLSNASVNRYVIEPLRAILRRAAGTWRQTVDMPDWKAHKLKEAQERVRELSSDEEEQFFEALRPDWHPFFVMALISGCRLAELVNLKWRDINWRERRFTVTGKGDRTREIPLTDYMVEILRPLPRAFDQVFTCTGQRAPRRGIPIPVTYEAAKTVHVRTCKKAGIEGFRFHDFRHTAASRLMRKTGNLKMVKEMLGHTEIATTARYAHLGQNDLLDAMNATQNATKRSYGAQKPMNKKGNSV